MSHWFHRNVLKATTLVRYDDVLSGPYNLTKLGNDLKKSRERVLELLPDPSHGLETINNVFIAYLSLMSGFFMNLKLSGRKMRYLFVFKWTHTLLGQIPQADKDAAFDIINMSVNVALWHMKHASFVASKKLVTMDEAKEIHTSLRKAAGILQMVLKDLIPLAEQGFPGSDLDPKVLNAYLYQCIAEAQEVTVARAIELQHNDNLISALANETSKMFETAEIHLKGLDESISQQWHLYLEIKKNIYLAYAYSYSGKNLLSQNQCGEAIRALKESQVFYSKALSLCKPYSKVKGPAKPVKPDGHLFFTKVNSTVTLLLEKCERENDFIYHQKIPEDPTELEMKATYGLAKPEAYSLPSPLSLWESAFEHEDQLPSVKEDTIKDKQGEKNPWPAVKHCLTITSRFPQRNHQKNPKKKEKALPPVEEIGCSEESDSVTDHGCVVQ